MIVDLFAGGHPDIAVLATPAHGRKLPKGWTHKVCPGCGAIHDRAAYRTQSRCPDCRREYARKPSARARRKAYYRAHKEEAVKYTLKWKRENPEAWKDSNRKSKYGIPHGTYARMLGEQNGGCAICGAPEPEGKSLHVDHCHTSGEVRGLLCDTCNRGLGYFKDDAALLRAAATYLQESRDDS